MTTNTHTDDEIVLPRDIAAEQYVLGCLVAFPERGSEVFERLTAADFFDPEHRKLFAAAQRQHTAGDIDPMLLAKATGQTQLLVSLVLDPTNAPTTSAHVPTEAAKIIAARKKRDRYDHHQTLATHSLNGWTADQLDRANEAALYDWKREREATATPDTFTLPDLRRQNPTLHPPVIEGLLREGETCNIIADSKVGKSWLGYGLAWSIITGQHWLGRFATTRGRILLIDNELHRSTLAYRIPAVATAMDIDVDHYGEDFVVRPMRGRLASLTDIAAELESIEPHTYSMILMDAKYRFIASGTSENDNGAETQFYNIIDQIAEHTRAAVVLIHHASKGDQSGKKVTDVGSGAGAQSRATDCHVVIRPHEEPGVAVMEAAVRSFAPVDPLPIRWDFPLWHPAFGVDPGKLKGKQTRTEERQTERDREGINLIVDGLRKGPATFREVRRRTGLSKDRCERLLDHLESTDQVIATETTIRGNRTREYSLPNDPE